MTTGTSSQCDKEEGRITSCEAWSSDMPLIPKLEAMNFPAMNDTGEANTTLSERQQVSSDELVLEEQDIESRGTISQIFLDQLTELSHGCELEAVSPNISEHESGLSDLERVLLYPFEQTDKKNTMGELHRQFEYFQKSQLEGSESVHELLFLPPNHLSNIFRYTDTIQNQSVFKTSELVKGISHSSKVLMGSMMRRPEIGIKTKIRFDLGITSLHAAAPGLAKVSEKCYFLVKVHHKYLRFAARSMGWTFSLSYRGLLDALDDISGELDATEPWCLQVTIYPQGTFTVTAHKTLPRNNILSGIFGHDALYKSDLDQAMVKLAGLSMHPEPVSQYIYQLYWDQKPTGIGYNSSFETTYQEELTGEVGFKTCHEDLVDVVAFSSSYAVLNGREVSIAVYRHGHWFTPSFENGSLCDPMRYVLLATKLISEAPIKVHDLEPGEEVLVFNSSLGVLRGIFCNYPPQAPVPRKRSRKETQRSFERRSASKILSDQREAQAQSTLTQNLPMGMGSKRKNEIPGTNVLRF